MRKVWIVCGTNRMLGVSGPLGCADTEAGAIAIQNRTEWIADESRIFETMLEIEGVE